MQEILLSFLRYVTGSSMHAAASSPTCFARMEKTPRSSPSPARSAVRVKATRQMEGEPALRKETLPLDRLNSAHLLSALPLHWTSVFLGTQQQLSWLVQATLAKKDQSRHWWSWTHKRCWGKQRSMGLTWLVSPAQQWQLAPQMASSIHHLQLLLSSSPHRISAIWGFWSMQHCRGQQSRRA